MINLIWCSSSQQLQTRDVCVVITEESEEGGGGIQNTHSCVQGQEVVSLLRCTYVLKLSLFMFLIERLSYGVFYYLQKFNLTFIQIKCYCQEQLFFSNEFSICCHEASFLYLRLFSRIKIRQNAFNCQVYSTLQCDTLLCKTHVRCSAVNKVNRSCLILLLVLFLLILNLLPSTVS